MHVTVLGTGYVGLVAGACLAETGNHVVCVDVDQSKIGLLKKGRIPIYEPGLERLVRNNLDQGRLRFTWDAGPAIAESEIVFIAVGTPADRDGSLQLDQVLAAARVIARHMSGETVVVTKSTVPVGTTARVRDEIQAISSHPVHVCANPEFLKEGAAVEDFMKPDRVVIGADTPHGRQVLEELYLPFVRTGNPILFMDPASAEITKYAANAMLATRISFMNMVADLCRQVGADVDMVRRGMGTDRRIGPAFLFAGCGYGGSCFPKDVQAFIRTLSQEGCDPAILEAVDQVNRRQKGLVSRKVAEIFGERLDGRVLAVWGLSFKPETDDMREAPSLVVVDELTARGAKLRVHDPQALDTARELLGDRVEYFQRDYDALAGADGLIVLTEWRQYRRPDFGRMRELLARPLIIDGRNIYDPARMAELGFEYYSVGRPHVPAPGTGALGETPPPRQV